MIMPDPTYPKRCTMWHNESTVLTGNAFVHVVNVNQRYNHYSYQNPPANADSFTHSMFLRAGNYTFFTLGATSVNRPRLDYYIDNVLVHAGQDWYSAAIVYNVIKSFAVAIAGDGVHVLKVVVNGRHASSTGWYPTLTKFWLKQAND